VSSAVEQLSDGQKEALRLYYQRLSAKEIAQALKLSPDGVHARLKTARRVLGVSDSMVAARLLHEHEYQRVVHQAVVVGPSTLPATQAMPRPLWSWLRMAAPDESYAVKCARVLVLATLMMAAAGVYLAAVSMAGRL
jgi:DNA-binding CsgD family transcriptional regulator